jgi:hypothetical protein
MSGSCGTFRAVDRAKLERFLRAGHRTWRWTTDGREGYEAVETTDRGLVWYRWSHTPDGGGPSGRVLQPYAALLEHGPVRRMPPAMLDELITFVRTEAT